jgi:hypothetical protein
MRVLGLVIMTEKKYDDIRRAQTMKIVELMTKVGSLEWDNKKLQEMLQAREEYIDKLLDHEIPIYE